MKSITGILLAGGHPWTNSSFETVLPRPLLPVAHKPLICHSLIWLQREGVNDVAVCGNRETRALEAGLERHIPAGMRLSYHEDSMPRGAAGSARDAAMASRAETFVVSEATAIPKVDLQELLKKHRASGACVTVVVHTEERPNGQTELHVPSGIYVFERRAFDHVPNHGFCDIKEKLIPELYAAGELVFPFELSGATPRVLDAASYMVVNEWMVAHRVGNGGQGDHEDELNGYVRVGSALVHRDAYVSRDASLVGPVLVGPGARILAGALVVGPTSIGADAVIESGAMVSRSSVWRRSTISEAATVDRCLIGDDAFVEPGAQLFRGVVVDGLSREARSQAEWRSSVAAVKPSRRLSLDMGARISRLVFGMGWSRSPAAQ